MRTFPDFENELRDLDSRLTVTVNQNYSQIANIKLDGVDVCPIPSGEIKEEYDPSYTVTFHNGFVSKHKTRPEALAITKDIIERIKTKEGADAFFGRD